MIKNGRQTATTLKGIREDHKARYRLGAEVAKQNGFKTAIDVGTGTGYGAYMLAKSGLNVNAYEIDQSAIDYGNEHYAHPELERHQADIAELDIPEVELLTAFEIVEHTHAAPDFLKRAAGKAKYLVASVPNEDVVPFKTRLHRQHVRHYTADQFRELLESCGWEVLQLGCQVGKRGNEGQVTFKRTRGRTLVAVARAK